MALYPPSSIKKGISNNHIKHQIIHMTKQWTRIFAHKNEVQLSLLMVGNSLEKKKYYICGLVFLNSWTNSDSGEEPTSFYKFHFTTIIYNVHKHRGTMCLLKELWVSLATDRVIPFKSNTGL